MKEGRRDLCRDGNFFPLNTYLMAHASFTIYYFDLFVTAFQSDE